MRDALLSDLVTIDPSIFVSKWILERVPFVFEGKGLEGYISWRKLLADRIRVDPCAMVVTGSAGVGVSLNPTNNFTLFDEKEKPSDIDVAIVSGFHFEIAWRHLRNMGSERYKLGKLALQSFDDHKHRLIYDGMIATDKIIQHLPFGREWTIALAEMAKIDPTEGREVNARIYRDFECLRTYHVRNTKRLREKQLEIQRGMATS
jgi:hypothetical protein